MNDNLIICRSLTHAQRMSAAMRRAGIPNRILRIPAGLVKSGCGYAVHIKARDLTRGLEAMRQEKIMPAGIFAAGRDGYQEVAYDLS